MINLYNIDCMEAMATMETGKYDLAIVDPPYGIDVANMPMGAGKRPRSSKVHARRWKPKDWDKSAPKKEYFEELRRVSKHQVIWGGNYFELPPCYGYIIWDKQIYESLSFASCEMAWHSFRKAPKIFRYSVFRDKKDRYHPTQKPIALYSWILNKFAKQGWKILDTHLGSGSSAIAAHNMGFDFDGYEIDEDYFKSAKDRIDRHQLQFKLF